MLTTLHGCARFSDWAFLTALPAIAWSNCPTALLYIEPASRILHIVIGTNLRSIPPGIRVTEYSYKITNRPSNTLYQEFTHESTSVILLFGNGKITGKVPK